MRLSNRLPDGLTAEALADGPKRSDTIDLTLSNPTLAEFPFAPVGPKTLDLETPYLPQAEGWPAARHSVAALLSRWGRPTSEQDVFLCAGTSEALGYVFKAWCDPGDKVVTCRPGYPLIDHVAELEGLEVVACPSNFAQGHWTPDLGAIHAALAAGARVVVLVSPNNPTGARLRADFLLALAQLCRRYQALFVVDEVFAPFGEDPHPIALAPLASFFLAVSLGGLSKAGLWPQLKVSWLSVAGDAAPKAMLKTGLQWVADAYLTVSQPVASHVSSLVEALAPRQEMVRARIDANMTVLKNCVPCRLQSIPVWEQHPRLWGTVLRREAGWYAIVVLAQNHPALARAVHQGRTLAAHIERQTQVLLLDGDMFDLPFRSALVSSLIVPPALFASGWQRVAAYLAAS